MRLFHFVFYSFASFCSMVGVNAGPLPVDGRSVAFVEIDVNKATSGEGNSFGVTGSADAELDRNGNIGKNNQGYNNRGNDNQGNYNQGDRNQGNYNQGSDNHGNNNLGNNNQGDRNQGNRNQGNYNQGSDNHGNNNLGNNNQGDRNQGNHNQGNYNVGDNHNGNFNKDKSWIRKIGLIVVVTAIFATLIYLRFSKRGCKGVAKGSALTIDTSETPE